MMNEGKGDEWNEQNWSEKRNMGVKELKKMDLFFKKGGGGG